MTDEKQRGVDPPTAPLSPFVSVTGENWPLAARSTTIMGCNLCTLQKREEHYKLLYEIAQVSCCCCLLSVGRERARERV